MEKSRKPKIRFKGFSDDWEQRKVYEIADRFDSLRVPVAANLRVSGDTPYYGANGIQDYVEGYTHDGEYVLVAEDGASDLKNYPVNYVNGRIWVNNHAHVLQGKNNIASNRFLSYAINMTNIESVLVGGGRAKLNADVMINLGIVLPTYKEQCRVAEYFSYLDNLITLHQRKLDKLINVKKSMLEKMFPKQGSTVPEIRFNGFTQAWEQRKVSEITKFHKQGFYTTEEYDNSKKYYLLRGTDLTENKLVLKDTPKIDATEKDYDAFKTEIGDFLIVRSGTVGTYGIVDVDIPAIFGSYLIDFRFDMEQVTNEFFGYFYQSSLFKSQLNKIIQASANTNINAENIKSTVISLPSLNEQRRISEYLGNLDNLITLHQRKLEKLKNIKKSMLEKMFV